MFYLNQRLSKVTAEKLGPKRQLSHVYATVAELGISAERAGPSDMDLKL